MTQQTILLVEDNDDDAELTLLAFREAKIGNPVIRVDDGVEALHYLHGTGRYAAEPPPLPAVVLLDLNLPRLSGHEVLKAIRADARTKRLPVVVLTSSAEEQDRIGAYDHHANSYVQKPIDHDHFVAAARQLGLYWVLLNLAAPDTSAT